MNCFTQRRHRKLCKGLTYNTSGAFHIRRNKTDRPRETISHGLSVYTLLPPAGLEPAAFRFTFVRLSPLRGLYLHHLCLHRIRWLPSSLYTFRYPILNISAWLGIGMETLMNCINCDKQTSNPKFCSRSCAVVYNNQIQAKRKKTNACEHCGETIYRGRTYCRKCWNNRRLEKMTQALDGTTLMAEYGQRAYQRNSRIRDWARTIYANSGLPRICTNCRYDKHVEICHIQSNQFIPRDNTVKYCKFAG